MKARLFHLALRTRLGKRLFLAVLRRGTRWPA